MILVTGATGLNGGLVVRRLSEKGIPVRALVREPDTRNATKADALRMLPGVTVVSGDLAQPASLAGALDGVDKAVLISSSDAAMADSQSAFVDAAKAASVGHIVKLSGIMPELDSDFRFARMHAQQIRARQDEVRSRRVSHARNRIRLRRQNLLRDRSCCCYISG